MSDVFAIIIEHYYLDKDVADGTWVIGDRLWPVASRSAALRSLKAPSSALQNSGISRPRIRDRYRCDGLVYCDDGLIGKSGISKIFTKSRDKSLLASGNSINLS